MERLTYDFCIGGNHCWQVKGADNLECREVCQCQEDKGCKDCPIAKAFDRLAAYEETGLEPEEIDRILDAYGRGMTLRTETAQRLEIVKDIKTTRLRELAQADKEGRCVVMPCQPGDKVSYKSSTGFWCNAVIKDYTPENIFITAETEIPNAEPLSHTFSILEIEAALRREKE
mgnify:FL=1|jgi:hypothetical protein